MRRATTADSSAPFDALVFHVSAWQCNRCGKLHTLKKRALICCAPCTLKEPFGQRRWRLAPHFCERYLPSDPCSTCGFTKKAATLWWRKYRRAYARQKAMEASEPVNDT